MIRQWGSSRLLTHLTKIEQCTDMPRPLRIQFPEAWYHVMNRIRRRDLIFKEKGDFYAFIDLLKDCVEMWNMRMVAYCLMGNH